MELNHIIHLHRIYSKEKKATTYMTCLISAQRTKSVLILVKANFNQATLFHSSSFGSNHCLHLNAEQKQMLIFEG